MNVLKEPMGEEENQLTMGLQRMARVGVHAMLTPADEDLL